MNGPRNGLEKWVFCDIEVVFYYLLFFLKKEMDLLILDFLGKKCKRLEDLGVLGVDDLLGVLGVRG